MTDREKAIVMAYTGVAMLTGDKLDLFYEYIAELLDRPVFTHELANNKVCDEIKEKSKADFVKLCRETTEPIKHGHWELYEENMNAYECSACGEIWCLDADSPKENNMNFCMNCGAKMDEVNEND